MSISLPTGGDGVASGQWHIDGNHLLPDAMIEAFNKYCLSAG